MKRSYLVVLLAIVLAGVLAFYVVWKKRVPGREVRAAELVPADTVLWAEMPDLERTSTRWQASSVRALWNEPEVQAFIEKPRSQMPAWTQTEARMKQIDKTKPRQAFFAITSSDLQSPKFVAGFAYRGSRGEVDALLAEPRKTFRDAFPAGKADLVQHAGGEIETYTAGTNMSAEAFREGWYFVSNDLETLQRTLARYDGVGTGEDGSLASQDRYKRALAPLPADADAVVFARTDIVQERLTTLLAAAGQPPGALPALSGMGEAFAYATRLEKGAFRDTMFTLSPNTTASEPLPRRALALSSPQTVLYSAQALPATYEMPASTSTMLAMVPGFGDMEKRLNAQGVRINDIGKIFGPELSILLDWPKGAQQPALLLALDIRDYARAKIIMDALVATPSTGSAGWSRTEEGPVTTYAAPAQGPLMPVPGLALSDKMAVFGLSVDSARASIARLSATDGQTLKDSTGFQGASSGVQQPTSSFGYLDLGGLLERAYVVLRPVLAMSMMFNPTTGEYIDISKLPAAETLSKHLGSTVLSEAWTAEGKLVESAGPVTFHQALGAIVVGTGAALLPTIQQNLASGTAFALPGFGPSKVPGAPIPGVQTPPPPTPGLPATPGNPDASSHFGQPPAPQPTKPAPPVPPEIEPPLPTNPPAPAAGTP